MIQYLIIVLLLVLWLYLLAGRMHAGVAEPPPPRALPPAEVPAAVPEVMEIAAATEESGVLVFRGALRRPPDEAYRRLREFLPAGLNPYLRQGERPPRRRQRRQVVGRRDAAAGQEEDDHRPPQQARPDEEPEQQQRPHRDVADRPAGAVGLLTFALLVSLLLPLPHAAWPAAGLHCPYS